MLKVHCSIGMGTIPNSTKAMQSQFVVSQALGNWQLYKKVKYHVTSN